MVIRTEKMEMKKAVIFAPFWREAGHVGNYRVDRFVRWLAADGFYVVLVRAGSVAGQRAEPWGVEVTVRDPLAFYRDLMPDGSPVKAPKPPKLRRWLSYLLFCPDLGITWSRAAANNSVVLEYSQGASFVISSSPPESAHIGAATLAKKIQAKLIVDMRDGWLDEPLKPLLCAFRLQRWREGRLEKRLLKQAEAVFVTSSVWKALLGDRFSFTQDKTVVLTNGCPLLGSFNLEDTENHSKNESIRLVYAGRFTGSRLSQKVGYLLEPLLLGLGCSEIQGVVTLLGRLEAADLEEVTRWRPQFKAKGWELEVKDAVPRDKMIDLLCQADGLLLLSASQAAIPSKIFEYLSLKKPIFAATLKSSAVWKEGESLTQVFLTDYRCPDELIAQSFISACQKPENSYEVPTQFSEENLAEIFIKTLHNR